MEEFRSTDFGFNGDVDWDVGQGGVAATIHEVAGTTDTAATIHVIYPNVSPSAADVGRSIFRPRLGGSTPASPS